MIAVTDSPVTLDLAGSYGIAVVDRLAERGIMMDTVRDVLGDDRVGGASPR